MRYLNRAGESVSRTVWEGLYRDPKYSVLGRQRRRLPTGEWRQLADVSWVGVATDSEQPPLQLYVVRSFQYHEGNPVSYCSWYADEAAAMRAYQSLSADLDAVSK